MKPPGKTPLDKTPPRMAAVLLGIARVARGRKDGLLQFGDTAQAVLAALAPLVAFLLVGALIGLLGGSRDAVEDVAAVTVGLLGPLVLSFEFARRWGRAGQWYRFATAFCWCQWAAPMVLLAVLVLMSVLMAGGMGESTAAGVGVAGLFGYGLWLHWFLARNALDLSALRAVLTTGLIILPQLADYAVNGAPPS